MMLISNILDNQVMKMHLNALKNGEWLGVAADSAFVL